MPADLPHGVAGLRSSETIMFDVNVKQSLQLGLVWAGLRGGQKWLDADWDEKVKKLRFWSVF